jgi:hypothetical protein
MNTIQLTQKLAHVEADYQHLKALRKQLRRELRISHSPIQVGDIITWNPEMYCKNPRGRVVEVKGGAKNYRGEWGYYRYLVVRINEDGTDGREFVVFPPSNPEKA